MTTIRLLILSLFVVGISNANAASVEKMSLEKFVDANPSYWQVEFRCSNSNAPRSMTRPLDNDAWCSAENTRFCDENKYSLSRRMCDDNATKSDSNRSATMTDSSKAQTGKKAVADSVKTSESVVSKPKQVEKTTDLSPVSKENFTREQLLAEQMQIEEQRILIDQKKLELRRKELDIQKNQLKTK